MACPSDAELLEVTSGGGDEARREHVRTCANCQQRVNDQLGQTTRPLDAPPRWAESSLGTDPTVPRELPADDVLAEGASVGPYVVSKRLGAGAMGAVYAAWDPRLEREVALKVLHLEGDLLDEARLLARLSHPNVVAVHEVLSGQDRAVLVMERVRGVSLRDWLAQQPRSVEAIVDVFTQCAEGLAAAHAAGVIHRDFKPDNVLVDDAGRARLVDFGLAMRVVRASGGIAGSPAYMALSQLEGAPADERSDQFSWWASLYEALCQQLPATASNFAGLFEARRRAPALERVPRRLRRAMERGLANDPAHRFPSMREAAAAIRSRRPVAWGVAAAAVVLATVAVLAGRAPDPCRSLTIQPAALTSRTKDPALSAAIASFAEEQQRCSALPAEARAPRAQCLEQVGQELDVALEALTGLDLEPAFAPRVLKRVRPAARCATAPLPAIEFIAPAERPALVESLRAHLQFEALRIDGEMERALEHAERHLASLPVTAPAAARAWAGLNAAAALTTVGRGREVLSRVRALEGIPGIGQRERTWVALGRWLFECFASAGDQCQLAGKLARRLSSELDEPWARAFELEIASRETNAINAVIDRWSRVPGAGFEAERALGNALSLAQEKDDLAQRRELLAIALRMPQPHELLRRRIQRLQFDEASREGDLALAQTLVEDLAPHEATPFERVSLRCSLLVRGGRYREALALLERSRGELTPKQVLLIKAPAEAALGAPSLEGTLQQLALLRETLTETDVQYVDALHELLALNARDAAALSAVHLDPEEGLLRAWYLAVLREDAAAEAEVMREAAATETPVTLRLRPEALLQEGRFEEVARTVPRLRAQCTSTAYETQLRVVEAWALRALGRRDEACRVMTHYAVLVSLTPRERARADTLLRECPSVGLSELPP